MGLKQGAWISVVSSLLGLLILSFPAIVELSAHPTVKITVESKSVSSTGERTTIKVSASEVPVPGIMGFQGKLTFEPSVLEVIRVRFAENFNIKAANVLPGEVRFAAGVTTSAPIPGGVLLELEVEAVGEEGDSSPVELTVEILSGPAYNPIEYEVINGVFSIGAPPPPRVADFTFSPPDPTVEDTIQFFDRSSVPDGEIVSWLWDFGDGSRSTEQNPTHRYTTVGTFTVRLTVTDDKGVTYSVAKEITVADVGGNKPPTADFTFSPEEPTTRDEIQFTDRSTDPEGELVSWFWDFGDGSGSRERNPTHRYSEPGTYTVKLVVEDGGGLSARKAKQIRVTKGVNRPPQADFAFSPEEPRAGETVQFIDKSIDEDGEVVKWEWDFGDGDISTVQSPSHKYARPGTYSVRLKVTDNEGASDTITKEIVVISRGAKRFPIRVHSFPNPAATRTTFRYKLPGGGTEPVLRIFDITGRLVFRTELDPAVDEFTWDLTSNMGKPLPNGPYFYFILAVDRDGKSIRSRMERLIIQR